MQFALVLILIFGLFIIIDVYTYQAIKTAFPSIPLVRIGYWVMTVAILMYMAYAATTFDRAAGPNKVVNTFMGLMILTYVPKLFVVLFMFSEDIIRLIEAVVVYITDQFNQGASSDGSFIHGRRKFISQLGLLAAAIPLGSILYGIYKGKYNFRVIRQTIFFDDLPEAFDGFTIAQISDVHSGSFDNPSKIEYAIDLVNEQEADMLVFTGDLVNNKAEEMEPWIDLFSRLNAPFGMYSIFGNHDYGDYVSWESEVAKVNNLNRLKEIHAEIGFDLLLNESRRLTKDGESIELLGVENWGAGGFAKYGDLEKAIDSAEPGRFKVLLSHDPSHFDEQVKKHPEKIDLTLSGHTHGMQFGIEIPGLIKWSPVKYRYPKWAGLYEENRRYLYVNRGFGYLAFPGRVGIWPEITILELKKSQQS